MSFQLEAVLGRNITLVYDVLNLQEVDRNKLKDLAVDDRLTVMDTPEIIVVASTTTPWVTQIGDRRIRITLSQETPKLGDFPLWDIASKAKDIISSKNSTLIAYGYNFDVGIKNSDRLAKDVLITKLLVNKDDLETQLKGKLISFAPRIVLATDDVQYDYIFEPIDKHRMKVHMNAHYQTSSIELPEASDLGTSFAEQYQYMTNTLIDFLDN